MSIRAELASAYSRTKVRVPLHSLMSRPRLMARLLDPRDARLWLVQAPAGYGKSSLMQQWATALADGGGDVAWLSLDASDREPELFASHLLRSLGEAGCPVEQRLYRLLEIEGGASARMSIIAAMNMLVDRTKPLHLFIDDAQHLTHTPSVACLELLLNSGPPGLKLLVATREELGLHLGRLRAHGLAEEIRADDLRFDLSEATALLARDGHGDLPGDDLVLAHHRTEGWAVGLKLFSMVVRNKRDYAPALRGFSGELRQIADFFAEDVFSSQPPELQDFLLRTSVLDWLSPGLCDSVLQIDNSRALIDRCEAAGLFLASLDDTRSAYAYHQLFAEHLRWRLYERSPGEAEQLYRRASEWLFAHGRQIEAFDCALKGRDPVRAAEMLDSSCDYLWAHGHQHTIQRLAASIPPHVQALYPRVMLTLAWRLTAQWKVEEAGNLLTVSRARLDEMERAGADPAFIRQQRWIALHRECQIAQTRYDLPALERHAKELLEQSNVTVPPYIMASVYNSLQYARREQFKLDDIERLTAQGRECCNKTGSNHSMIFAGVHAGPSYWLKGQSDKAIEVLTHALGIATEWAGADAPIASLPGMPLAAIRYERNEIVEASALIEQHMPVATVAGFVDQLLAGWITKSRLLRLRGDPNGACAALVEAVEFGARSDLERLRIVATAEHVRLLLRIGRPDEAMRLAQRRGIHEPASAGRSGHQRFTTLDGAVALAWCRLAAVSDRLPEALRVARQWRSFVVAAQAVQSAVEWDILLAELLLASGEKLAARRTIAQAVARAAPGRAIRPFLDQGEPVAMLLGQLDSDMRGGRDPGDAFLAVLIGHARAEGLAPQLTERGRSEDEDEEDDALMGQISSREIQILGLAGAGALNREIGERLGLTEGTVKWYLQQVFDKVGIRDRVRAAQKLRRLGMMQ
ncbi:LuxR C-terminal-related transcriptional regulator [Sphingomonas sp. MMS24-J13]|uniref:LuxR C-terminal-related transcriptional regulator n=1 Tax=Sphingomonas sp. MMS24-J13 TaxID=3238686 RepID=UPI00384DD447